MGWARGNRHAKVAEETLALTWGLPSFAKDDRPVHPTPKQLDAFGIPMRQHVARGGLCYEPFCGSGSQIMAGEANGRRGYAMEISPAYIDVAVERWQADTGREAFLHGDGRTFRAVQAERLGDDADPTFATLPRRRALEARLARFVTTRFGVLGTALATIVDGDGCRASVAEVAADTNAPTRNIARQRRHSKLD